MKKLFLTLVMLITAFAASAQKDPLEIVMKNQKLTGGDKISANAKEITSRMVMKMELAGVKVPYEMIMQGADKFRITMKIDNQEMLIISDGDQGWMKMAGTVQELPEEALAQQSQQGDVLSTLRMSNDDYDFEYLGEKDGLDMVQATLKADGQSSVIFFNAEGYMVSCTVVMDESAGAEMDGKAVDIAFSAYKQYGDLYIPSKYVTKLDGQEVAKINLLEYELNYPVESWMFEQPE